jgi:hypothetical protein
MTPHIEGRRPRHARRCVGRNVEGVCKTNSSATIRVVVELRLGSEVQFRSSSNRAQQDCARCGSRHAFRGRTTLVCIPSTLLPATAPALCCPLCDQGWACDACPFFSCSQHRSMQPGAHSADASCAHLSQQERNNNRPFSLHSLNAYCTWKLHRRSTCKLVCADCRPLCMRAFGSIYRYNTLWSVSDKSAYTKFRTFLMGQVGNERIFPKARLLLFFFVVVPSFRKFRFPNVLER